MTSVVDAALSRSISAALAVEHATGTLDPTNAPAIPTVPPVRVTTPFMRLNERNGGALAPQGDMGTRNPMVRDRLPVPDADLAVLQRAIDSLKQISDVREGRSGSVLDKHLTMRDLLQDGVLSLNIGSTKYTNDATSSLVLGQGYVDPRPVLITPPTPFNLTASAAFKSVILRWDLLNYANHAYVEIWRHTADAIGAATLIGTSLSNLYTDASGTVGTTYYYWVRAVAITGPNQTSGALGPFNATAGTAATLGGIIGTDIAELAITASKLSQGTYPNINLVSNPGAEDGTEGWVFGETNGTGTGPLTSDSTDKAAGTKSFLINKSATGAGRGYASRSFPVIPGETYSIRARVRGSGATGSGLYLGVFTRAVAPPSTYITSATGAGDLYDTVNSLASNVAFPAAWTLYENTITIPAGQYWASFYFYNWTNGPISAWFDDISVGRQITASFLAADSIAVGTLAVQNGAIVNAMIGTAAIDDAKIANLSAVKITAGTLDVARLGANSITAAKIAANTLTASEISTTALSSDNTLTRNLTVRDGSGNIIFSSGTNLSINRLTSEMGFTPYLMWDFRSTADAWGSSGATLSNGTEAITITSTGIDPQFLSPTISVVGSRYTKIRARVKRTAGSTWDGTCFYVNGGHGYSGSFNKVIPDSTVTGQWVILEWDMAALTLGGSDWTGGTTAAIRLDFGGLASDVFDIDWVAIGGSSGVNIDATNISTFIASAAIGDAQIGNLSADKINAGSIRGINVNAASHTTVGSFLTTSCSGGAGTLNLHNTADFSSSGIGVIFESGADYDTFTYSGKTSTTLTGVSGVLAHASGVTCIPLLKSITVDKSTNHLKVYADIGNGTIDRVAAIGGDAGFASFGFFGSTTAGTSRDAINAWSVSGVGVSALSDSSYAVLASSVSGIGVSGTSNSGSAGVHGAHSGTNPGVLGQNVSSGPAVSGEGSTGPGVLGSSGSGSAIKGGATSGYGGEFTGNATKGSLLLTPRAAPSGKAQGALYVNSSDSHLYVGNGSAWNQCLLASDVPGTPPTCFPSGALVLMADYTWRRIETVKEGEMMWGPRGPEPVVKMDRPYLGTKRRMLAFSDGHRWSEEHAHWVRRNGKAWWWSANPNMWRNEVKVGAIGGLKDNASMLHGDDVEFAHLQGWKANQIRVIPTAADTKLYLPMTSGSPIVVDGYLVGAGVNEAGYDYEALDWDYVLSGLEVHHGR